MKVRSLFSVGLVLLFAVATATGQIGSKIEKSQTSPKPGSKLSNKETDADELTAIRKSSEEFTKAFNSGDARALAMLWTEDGDYIDGAGQAFSGREAIEKEYQSFFAENKGQTITIAIDSLRLLNRTAAIEDGHATLKPAPRSGAGRTKYTVVHVKVGDRWLMSTARDTPVETSSTERELDDMEWLIGTWIAEEHGSHMESVCRWVASKSFVERTYTVQHPDETTSSGIQIIGYNPQGGHVQSWNFSSDGGFAVGVWTRKENGWSAEISGITGRGDSTTAVNLLSRLDDNAYCWRSVSRTAGGLSVPDSDEVVFKRNKASK